jgi:hypothetical protein
MVQDRFQLAFTGVYQRRGQAADTPRIKVKMFYSPHATREDLTGLIGEFGEREKSQDSIHAYFPEAFGYSEKRGDLDLFRQSSFGEISSKKLNKRLAKYDPVTRRNIENVYFFHIPIGIIDVPVGDRLKKESNEIWGYKPPCESDFKQVLDYTKIFLGKLAKHINKRENYMLSQITPENIEELLKTYPGLVGNKTELNILLSLGSAHAPMPSDFSNHSFTNEGIIRNKFFRKPVNEESGNDPVNDELAAKVFLEYFIDKYISNPNSYWPIDDSNKLARVKRIFVGEMKTEDPERIFNNIKQSLEKRGVELPPTEELRRLFSERGLPDPEFTNLDEYLNNPTHPQHKNIQ